MTRQREGFFGSSDFAALVIELPSHFADLVRFLRMTGWRRGNVFHNAGVPIGNFQRAWVKACRAAGVPGRLVHDLRRTAARDFIDAGVSEDRIMRLCGWRTRAMFDRYNITNQDDLNDAVAQRFNGKQAANKALETASAG